jgi:hypothetical protein
LLPVRPPGKHMRTILASTEGLKFRFANGCKKTLNQVSKQPLSDVPIQIASK